MTNKFKANIGLNERYFRIIVSVMIFYFALKYSEWLLVFAVLFLVTGIVGWSPSYQLFGMNTNRKKTDNNSDKKNSSRNSKKKK